MKNKNKSNVKQIDKEFKESNYSLLNNNSSTTTNSTINFNCHDDWFKAAIQNDEDTDHFFSDTISFVSNFIYRQQI